MLLTRVFSADLDILDILDSSDSMGNNQGWHSHSQTMQEYDLPVQSIVQGGRRGRSGESGQTGDLTYQTEH